MQKYLYMDCGYFIPPFRIKHKICTSHKNQMRNLFSCEARNFYDLEPRWKWKGREWLGSPFKRIRHYSIIACWVSAFPYQKEALKDKCLRHWMRNSLHLGKNLYSIQRAYNKIRSNNVSILKEYQPTMEEIFHCILVWRKIVLQHTHA